MLQLRNKCWIEFNDVYRYFSQLYLQLERLNKTLHDISIILARIAWFILLAVSDQTRWLQLLDVPWHYIYFDKCWLCQDILVCLNVIWMSSDMTSPYFTILHPNSKVRTLVAACLFFSFCLTLIWQKRHKVLGPWTSKARVFWSQRWGRGPTYYIDWWL